MLSFDNFLKYYNSQEFAKGMRNYFIVETQNGHSVIKHINQHFRIGLITPNLSLLEQDENNIYFTALFFFVSLCNYTINKLLGQESLHDFLKATQWPLTSCGMAGICPPQQTLQEADLVYEKDDANGREAHALFLEVVPFMKDELNKFFSGNDENLNQDAYDVFCKAIAEKVEDFWQIADPLIEEFTFYQQ